MRLIKSLFILMPVLLVAGCSNTVSAEDLETYQSYQNKLDDTIVGFVTNELDENQIIACLEEFEDFMERTPFPEELKGKQKEALNLYKEGIKENDADKISDAAFMNFEAMDLFETLTDNI